MATYEQPYHAPSTLDPSLLGRSAYDPAGTFKQPSWVVQQFQPLPDWGWKSASQDIGNALPNAMNDVAAYQKLGTTSLANQAAQTFLNKVVHGTTDPQTGQVTYDPANIQVGPNGPEITTPAMFQNKTAVDVGLSHFNTGAQGQPANSPTKTLIDSLRAGAGVGTPQSSAAPSATSSSPAGYPEDPYRQAVASSIASGNTTASTNQDSGMRTDISPADSTAPSSGTPPSSLASQPASPLASAGSGASASGAAPATAQGLPVPYAPAPTKDTSSPTPIDDPSANRSHFTSNEVLAWHNKYVNTDGVSARQEFDPTTGLPTERNIVTLKNGSQQPIHSAYILAHKQQNPGTSEDWETPPASSSNPVLGTDPAKVAAAAAQQAGASSLDPAKVAALGAAATQDGQQQIIPSPAYGYGNSGSTLSSQLGPPTALSLSGPPPTAPTAAMASAGATASGIAPNGEAAAHAVPGPPPSEQAPANWGSSPQATTAAINQVGSDPEAGNRQLSGVRTTDPTQNGIRPVPRAQLVDGSGSKPVSRAQPAPTAAPLTPIPPREPTALPSFDGPKESGAWSKWTGASNPEDFGKIVANTNNWIGPRGNGPINASNNAQTQWQDIYSDPKTGGDGQFHRVYIDPSRDGGKKTFSSIYIRSGVENPTPNPDGSPNPNASGTREHRDYLDGTSQDVDNKPLLSELTQMGNLIIKQGTGIAGVPPSQMKPKDLEASYRAALQKENYENPLDGEDKKQIDDIWNVMKIAKDQQDVIKSLGNTDHSDWRVAASDFAARNGQKIPDWLGGLVKGVTGYDLKTPNPKLRALMQNHENMVTAVRNLTARKSYNEKGEAHLDSNIGNPLDSDYPEQLSNFLHTYIYPDAGRAIDIAQSQKKSVPKDFFAMSNREHFPGGDKGTAPGTPGHPIIVKSQADEDKAAKGESLMDATGKEYIKTWD